MTKRKQPKATSVKPASHERQLLRLKRDVAWQLFTATHDELEAWVLNERDSRKLFHELLKLSDEASKMAHAAATRAEMCRMRVAAARKHFNRAEALYWPLDAAAREARLPEPTTDYEAALERVQQSALLHRGCDAIRELQGRLDDAQVQRMTEGAKQQAVSIEARGVEK